MDVDYTKSRSLEYITLPFEVKALEVKEDAAGGKFAEFSGYAAVTGNLDQGRDIIEPGAFKDTIAEGTAWPIQNDHIWDIKHNAGFNKAAREDDHGLFVEGELNLEKEAGREAYSTMKQAQKLGAKAGLSIGYKLPKGGAEYDDAIDARRLKRVGVFEYSNTLFPMNQSALVTSVKSVIESDDKEQVSTKKRELERILRDAGCSRSQSLKAVAAIFECDAEDSQEEAKELADYINEMTKRVFS